MKLTDFDVYRKVPKDFSEGTKTGAILSIISISAIIILFISELSTYLSATVISEMIVDETMRGGSRIRIDINMTIPAIPCVVISVDAQDVMGTHTVDLGGGLKKRRLDKDGKDLGILPPREIQSEVVMVGTSPHHQIKTEDQEWIKTMVGEGCRLEGFVTVNKVPGNVHISAHTTQQIFPYLGLYDPLELDIRHTVHHFSMDNTRLRSEDALNDLINIRNLKGSFTPLDGFSFSKSGRGQFSEYYLKIVPTTFVEANGDELYTYQLTAHNNLINSNTMMPAIYFRYDFSPITVRYHNEREGFLHFIVQVSAIVGGVFTVAGMIDGFIYRSSRFFKKVELGKQG